MSYTYVDIGGRSKDQCEGRVEARGRYNTLSYIYMVQEDVVKIRVKDG